MLRLRLAATAGDPWEAHPTLRWHPGARQGAAGTPCTLFRRIHDMIVPTTMVSPAEARYHQKLPKKASVDTSQPCAYIGSSLRAGQTFGSSALNNKSKSHHMNPKSEEGARCALLVVIVIGQRCGA